jgi:hypothetical protein
MKLTETTICIPYALVTVRNDLFLCFQYETILNKINIFSSNKSNLFYLSRNSEEKPSLLYR